MQLTITGSTKEAVVLRDPELLADVYDKFSIVSLNPTSAQPYVSVYHIALYQIREIFGKINLFSFQVISNNLKVKFMWELALEKDFSDKAALKFAISYSAYDKTSVYKYEFDVCNFVVSLFSLFINSLYS